MNNVLDRLNKFEKLLIQTNTEDALQIAYHLYEEGYGMELFKHCTMVTGREVDYQYFSFDHGTLTMEALIGASVTYCKKNSWPLIDFAIRYIGHLRKIPWELGSDYPEDVAPSTINPPIVDQSFIDQVAMLLRKGLPMRAFTLLAPLRDNKRAIFNVFFSISAVELSQLAHNLIFTSAYWRLWDLFNGIQRVRLLVELLTYFGCAMRITDIQNTLASGKGGRGVYEYIEKKVDVGKGIRLFDALHKYEMEEVHWMYNQGYFSNWDEIWTDLWKHSIEKPNSLAHAPIYIKSGHIIYKEGKGSPTFDANWMIKNLIAEFYRQPRGRPQTEIYTFDQMNEMIREGRDKLRLTDYTVQHILELETPEETLAAIERWITNANSIEELFQEAMENYVVSCQVNAINVQYATQALYNGAIYLDNDYLKYVLFRSIQLGQEFQKDKIKRVKNNYSEIHSVNETKSDEFHLTIESGRHNRIFTVPKGDLLYGPALPLLLWLDRTECGGNGKCGRCRVIVTEGSDKLSPLTDAEKHILQTKGFAECERLSCQTRAFGNVKILVD